MAIHRPVVGTESLRPDQALKGYERVYGLQV